MAIRNGYRDGGAPGGASGSQQEILPLVANADPLLGWVFTAGAQIKAAGSGLPMRITTADFIRQQCGNTTAAGAAGMIFDPDNVHYWYPSSDTQVAKRKRDDNSLVTTIAGFVNPTCMSRDPSGLTFFVGSVGVRMYEVNYAGTIAQNVAAGSIICFRVPGVAGKVWWHNNGGTLTEIDWPAGTATGRTIAGINYAGQGVTVGGVGYIYVQTGGTTMRQIRESDLVVTNTWTFALGRNNMQRNNANESSINGALVVNADGSYYMADRFIGGVDLYTSALTPTYSKRIVWPNEDLNGGPIEAVKAVPFFQISDDGKYALYLSARTDGGNKALTAPAYIIRNIQVQEAYRDFVPASNITLNALLAAGEFCNEHGPVLGDGTNPVRDYRKTKFYYQIDGGVRTEIVPNLGQQAIDVNSGQTVRLTVSFDCWEKPASTEPWVRGSVDNGPTWDYTLR